MIAIKMKALTCVQWKLRCLEQLCATSFADSSFRSFGTCEEAPSFTVTGLADALVPASLFSLAYIMSDLPLQHTQLASSSYCTQLTPT